MANFKHIVSPEDILIHKRGTSHVTPHRYMLQSGSEKDCIDVAILAEGYTEKEMDVFYQDAQRTCESLFSHEPFRSMKQKFNIVAVAVYRQRRKCPPCRPMEANCRPLAFRHVLFRTLSDYQPGEIDPQCAGGNPL